MAKIARRASAMQASATVGIADQIVEMKRNGRQVLDFSAGRAVEASPDFVNQAASDALLSGDTHQTPAQGKFEYRQQVANKLSTENGLDLDPDENIIATLGCKNGLTLALLSLLNPGDEVIVEDPCFVSYAPTIALAGGKTVPVPLRVKNRFRWDPDELREAVTPHTRCLLLCSPHNPTGTVHTRRDLDRIAEVARENDLWVISDEVYERVTWQGRKHICMATRPEMKERSIGLMGFTKTFSMGGWRIGFAYGPGSVVRSMTKIQQNLMTCAGSFTQAGAMAALAEPYPPEIGAMWADWEKKCEFVAEQVNSIPQLECATPEGGFYAWIDITGTGEASEPFCARLLADEQIALVPGSAFGPGGEHYVRMTCVKSWDDIRSGIARLKRAAGDGLSGGQI